MNTKKILVLRGGAIGDFIVTVPALQTLRNHWYDSTLELVCKDQISELAKVTGIAEHTISLDSAEIAQLYSPLFDEKSKIADYIKSFDIIVCYLYDPDKVLQNNLMRIIGNHSNKKGRPHIIFHSPVGIICHATEHFLEPLKTLGIALTQDSAIPHLKLPRTVLEKSQKRMQKFGKNILTIHPGSGSQRKNWHFKNFVELAKRISDKNIVPVFIFGEAEQELFSMSCSMLQSFGVLNESSLVEVAGFIAVSIVYVGNDSGITHLASALGVPTLALFGHTEPNIWGPRGKDVTIIKSVDGKVESISVDTVLEHILNKNSDIQKAQKQ